MCRPCLAVFCAASILFGETIAITGTIKDRVTNQPVAGAIVSLAKQSALRDTTGIDGRFSFSGTVPLRNNGSRNSGSLSGLFVTHDALVVRSASPAPAVITISDLAGKRVYHDERIIKTAARISPNLADGFYVCKIASSAIDCKHSFWSLNNRFQSARRIVENSRFVKTVRAKSAVVIDTLIVSKAGYERATVLLTSYSADTVVFLDSATKKPNVIFIMLDDVGYGNFGCTGDRKVKTPHIDKFYKEAVRFTDFHVSPTCSPTRAALMTGRFNNSVGVWHTILQRDLPHLDQWFLPQAMKGGGYVTGMFGKWHLGDTPGHAPEDRGFDLAIRHGFGNITGTGDYWGNNYGINGHVDSYFRNGVAQKYPGYCTSVWFEQAIDFIEQNRDKPFFVHIAPNIAHTPMNPPPGPYMGMYGGVSRSTAVHYAMLTQMDERFDSLRTFLEKEGLEENTILMFSTDNGMTRNLKAYNANMKGYKTSHYEGGHRVPLFVRWPAGGIGGSDGGGGKDIGDLVAHVDVMPTLLDLCGISAAGHSFDGRTLAPLLKGEVAKLGERILVVDNQRDMNLVKYKQFAVMKDKWRLIGDGGVGNELYNIADDPGQKKNVIAGNAVLAKELRAAYEEWWAEVSKKKDEESSIPIGEKKTMLHAGDMRVTSGASVHLQSAIKNGTIVRGYWEVEVTMAGKYRFDLRRWPEEVDGAIASSGSGGKALNLSKATLKIFDQTHEKDVVAGDRFARFEVDLPAGKTHLDAFFSGGVTTQAYFVSIRGRW